MADLLQKEMIFGFVEVIFGMATAVAFAMEPVTHSKMMFTFLLFEGVVGALVPLVMRFSVRFFTNNSLPKILDIMVLVWGFVFYLLGGILVIAYYQVQYQLGAGAMATVVAIMCIVDLIVSLVAK